MEPVVLTDILPCLALQNYVRKYQVYRFSFEKNVIPPVKYYTPRPEHSITFYVRDLQKYSKVHSDVIYTYPRCVINGIYTIPINRHGDHDFCAIKIVLHPTTLSRLGITPVTALNNGFINAEDCFGKDILLLCERLLQMKAINAMIEAIERFFINLTSKQCKSLEPLDRLTQYLLNKEENTSLSWLAGQSCLSVRQFIRRFEDHIGISPKMFQKIIRFDRAYRMKNNAPHLDWLYIALACGYYDYQHLVKDFKEFTFLTPTAFYEIEKKSPERSFFLHEG